MGDNRGDATKKQAAHHQEQLSSSTKESLEESSESRQRHLQQPSTVVVTATGPPFITAPLYVPIGATSSFEQQFDQSFNTKRPRYDSGQWKLLPSPSSLQLQAQMAIITSESSPSLTTKLSNQQTQAHITAASLSDTASSPTQSPLPSTTSSQETNKPEGKQFHYQFRKGKCVSPIWKPNEMLWLARAWRIQYQGGSDASGSSSRIDHQDSTGHIGSDAAVQSTRGKTRAWRIQYQGGSDASGSSSRIDHQDSTGHIGSDAAVQSTRGKTRADKDRDVAEFLNKHGINRDAKTAGTKWDNMLGEFRKVYGWERGEEKELVGKSYFRLSPYERKLHRLPASFDEEVFEELSQFMGPRMRTSQSKRASAIASSDEARPFLSGSIALPPPLPFKEDELPLSVSKQLITTGGGDTFFHGTRGSLLGFDTSLDVAVLRPSSSKELRRIGKVRMKWEESVSLWAEESEHLRGRVRLQGSSFLNADEITFFVDAMVACTMEAFEDGPLKGLSVDRFVNGQQVKVFGRRKSSAASASSGFIERAQLPFAEPPIRSLPPSEFQDPTDYYMGCLRVPPTTLPSLFELSWHLQEPPPEEYRFPLRREVYRDLPPGKEVLFTAFNELLDCRAIMYDILSPIIRTNPSVSAATATSRDSYFGLWDDCINRVVSKFCSVEMVIIRKSPSSLTEPLQDQWPHVTGFVRNFCLWRGEETDQLREGQLDPPYSIMEKLLWSFMDLPYILGYYAVGYKVTFCALSRSQDRIIRTDLYSVDLSSPSERLKAIVPCCRIAGLLPLLADRCFSNVYNVGSCKQLPFSDFERIDLVNGSKIEMTPNTVMISFSSKKKWAAVKELYDILDHRIPHAEFICRASEKDLTLVFKPRGFKFKPLNCDQLVEALKYVTKALVALHDLCFMHRDLCWDKVLRRSDRENEWFVCGFDKAVGAPQIYPLPGAGEKARGRNHAPEIWKGLHGVKVDVWGVGQLVKTCGLKNMPKMLKELQSRCLDQNPEQRPTAADCYHHLLRVQSASSGPSY